VRESIVESVEAKQGRSGALVIVKVVTTLSTLTDMVLLTERQDLVYRDNPPRPPLGPGQDGLHSPGAVANGPLADLAEIAATRPGGSVLTSAGEDRWNFHTDPTRLMRFSAATANAHRIHYDWPYATVVEGYPGLVVHGPLSTLSLIESLRLAGLSRQVQRVEHRNTAPLFCGQSAQIALRRGDGTAQVDLTGPHDQTIAAMTADLTAS
jgi:3-methylfumaryl-CoA hydratase